MVHDYAGCFEVQIALPIRRKQHQFHQEELVRTAVALALCNHDCDAILLVFDGEDHCPATLGPQVLQWAQGAARGKPCEVVVAYREYESWFLAALESLRGQCEIASNAVSPTNPEGNRDAKGKLEEYMPPTSCYSPTIHQAKLSAHLDLASTHQQSRSFKKLTKAVGNLLTQLGQPLPAWPPAGW